VAEPDRTLDGPEPAASPLAENQAKVPEVYVNGVKLESSYYDLVLIFSLSQGGIDTPVLRVRMAPQHEIVMLAFLLKHWELYTKVTGGLPFPPLLAQELGITDAIEVIQGFAARGGKEEGSDA